MTKAYAQHGIVTDIARVDPYTIFQPAYAAQFIDAPDDVQPGWTFDGATFTAPPVAPRPLAELQAQAWASIQVERERRRVGGVKAGQHWFHSDDASRIQQLGLVMLGANVPPIQWKTLQLSGPPVFVTMSQQLAGQIFQAVVTWDAQVFAASETHRAAMEASADPSTYDFSGGWPVAIWEEPAP